ncbi:glycosyltransferase family 2 protein [Alteromonas pelagimontana]|uniref:Glycosyltransferase family 2 protein n=1 Tax=Alteromonas pelagimontana TaxID=1858656 RepID=A0A6M4MH23_9ALTE|nr:glycosyltransferase family 2 protein [Alteromonas pelagimontana]QJR81486.1 glycosyltransferase family 2 protein [Alteromonas pelagimontana]
MKISVVIPAKNEEGNLKPLVDEIYRTFDDDSSYEIIYVDDGSTDNTYQKLLYLHANGYQRLKVLKHRCSVGQSGAIWTGVSYAKGELIVTLDADGQNDPADIPSLLAEAYQLPVGSNFCVAGYRKNRKDTTWKCLQSKLANAVRSRILGDDTPDTGCGLKVFPRTTFLSLPYFDHMHRFLPALIRRQGGLIKVVSVNHRERQFGKSKYNMLGRLGVGLVDMAGVLWLQKRNKRITAIPDNENLR